MAGIVRQLPPSFCRPTSTNGQRAICFRKILGGLSALTTGSSYSVHLFSTLLQYSLSPRPALSCGTEEQGENMNSPLTLLDALTARLDGPLHFRFFAQPAVASFLAICDGVKDSQEDKPAYFWAILSRAHSGKYLLCSGLKSIGKVMVFAVVLEAIYQVLAFHTIRIAGVILAPLLLAIFPYLIVRGPAKRVARWCFFRREDRLRQQTHRSGF